MERVGDRLRIKRESLGWTQAELAARSGVPQQTIGGIESPAKDIKRPREALELAQALGVSLNWLLNGEEYSSPVQETHESESQLKGETIRQTSPSEVPSGNTKERLSEVVEIDARGVAEKGATGDLVMGHTAVAKWLLPSDFMRFELRTTPDQTIMLEIFGDAMAPEFNSGDRAIVDTSQRNPAYGGFFAIEMDGARIVRRLELIPDTSPKQVKIKPENDRHSTYILPLAEVRIVGRATGRVHRI